MRTITLLTVLFLLGIASLSRADDVRITTFTAPDAGCSTNLPPGYYAISCKSHVYVATASTDAGAPTGDDVNVPAWKLFDVDVRRAQPHICVRVVDGGTTGCSVFQRVPALVP